MPPKSGLCSRCTRRLAPPTSDSPSTAKATSIHGNFLGGARYFARLKRQFGSDELALAAYNAGPGRVRQFGGVPPIRETQNYVSRISEYRQHPGIPQLLGVALR